MLLHRKEKSTTLFYTVGKKVKNIIKKGILHNGCYKDSLLGEQGPLATFGLCTWSFPAAYNELVHKTQSEPSLTFTK